MKNVKVGVNMLVCVDCKRKYPNHSDCIIFHDVLVDEYKPICRKCIANKVDKGRPLYESEKRINISQYK